MKALLIASQTEMLVSPTGLVSEHSCEHAPQLLKRIATEHRANERAVGLERLDDLQFAKDTLFVSDTARKRTNWKRPDSPA